MTTHPWMELCKCISDDSGIKWLLRIIPNDNIESSNVCEPKIKIPITNPVTLMYLHVVFFFNDDFI